MSEQVTIRPRSTHWLLRLIDKVAPKYTTYFTTFGRVVYCPDFLYEDTKAGRFNRVLDHELYHVDQYAKYGMFVFMLIYLAPVYGRWFLEREPFLNDIRKNRISVDAATEELWYSYFFPWPRFLMRRWFIERLGQ